IDGGAGTNVIRFSRATGNDTLNLSSSISNITEVEASDAAGGNLGTAALNINAGGVQSSLHITGNAGANTLQGATNFATTIAGGAGNDVLGGGQGNDSLDGGAGNDTATYFFVGFGVAADLGVGTTSNDGMGGGGSDTLVSIENLT